MRTRTLHQATLAILGLLFTFLVPLTAHSQKSRRTSNPPPKDPYLVDVPSASLPQEDFSIGEVSTNKPLTPRQIVEKVLPSVVLIVAQDENGEAIGQGSGFVYKDLREAKNLNDPNFPRSGLVATNLHVFKRASQAYVKVLGNGVTYKVAEVVGFDVKRDLCVVRIDETSIPPLTLNGLSKPAVGDEVYVASNPKGLEGSFSKGIVSSIRRDAGLIQIDAAISPGSSGGAVVNTQGEVIGIAVSSLVGGQNLNFAIPVEYLSKLAQHCRKCSVVSAGAESLRDRDKDKLEGLVQSVSETTVRYGYDERSRKDYEKPAELTEQSKYDLNGNKVESYTPTYGRYFYTFDEQGFMTSYRHNGKQHDLTPREGLEQKWYSRKFSNTEETTFGKKVYDRDGDLTELTSGSRRYVSTYGRDGFVVEEKAYLNDKLEGIFRYTYQTDEYGNWIKKYSTFYSAEYPESAFSPTEVVYREITYWQ